MPDEGAKTTRRGVDYGLISAAAAMLIGICALGVSVYEVRLMRTQARAEVWPMVEVSSSFDRDSYAVSVENKGIGPALIRDVQITVDDDTIKDWAEFYRELGGTDVPDVSMARTTGNILRPNEEVTTVRFGSSGGELVWRNAERAKLSVCYCSAVHQCWRHTLPNLNSDLGHTVEVAACPRESKSLF